MQPVVSFEKPTEYEMQMVYRKIALAIASAMVLSLATEIIKYLERKLGEEEKSTKPKPA